MYVGLISWLFAVLFAFLGVSRPRPFWQYMVGISLISGVAAAIVNRGAYWPLPVLGTTFAVILAAAVGSQAGKDREVSGLTSTQRGLATLLVSTLIGIGLLGWFGREGESREAHLLVRTVFSALLVMILWSTAIIRVQKQWRMEDVRLLVLRVSATALMLVSYLLTSLHSELSKYSATNLDGQFMILRIAVSWAIFFIMIFFTRSVIVKLLICAMPFLWAVITSYGHYLANIPMLSAMAPLPLAIRFPNWWTAGGIWAVILAILAFGLGVSEPQFVMHGMVATLIFAFSYWLGLRLEAFAVAERIEEQAPKRPLLIWPALDRRSLGIALAAGSVVLLVGGGLLYASYSQERALARANSQRVAERLADRVANELLEVELRGLALSRLPLGRITSQAEFEQETDLAVSIDRNTSIGWAPLGILRFSNPRKGNEAAVGLELLANEERKEDFEHVIATGKAHWLGPYNLARGGRGLLHVVPIYWPGAEPSRQSFVGFISILLDLEVLEKRRLEYDTDIYKLRLWLANPTIKGRLAGPQLIFGSTDGDEAYAEFGAKAQATGSPEGNKGALTVTVEAFPRSIEALHTLPSSLQGLVIMALLLGGGVAIVVGGRRQAQALLVAKEQQLEQVFKGSAAAQILVSRSGAIVDANEAALLLFQYTKEELIDLNFDELVPVPHGLHHAQLKKSYFAAGSPSRNASARELEACDKSGRVFPIQLGLAQIAAEPQDLVLATVIDLSDRKASETARTQFLSNISHDLRTPLSVVIGSAQMLEHAPLEGEDRKRLQRLQQASSVLYNLVNDVLDWSKIEAGEIDLEHEPVSLTETFETIMSMMGEVAEAKGLTLTCDKAADLPHYVIGDATRIQQILLNLVGNAIKFTDEGEVRIRASKVAPHEADNVRLKLEVCDTGIGISSEDQELLFERFSQIDVSSTRRFQGTGLGLSIVKQLADLMGGSVGVESKLGVGSIFWAEVELGRLDDAPIAQEGLAERQEKPLAGKYVLVVDDGFVIAELAEILLETAGAKTSTCTNGQEALDWLVQNPGKADIVLMDVQMPTMDGITAVTIMRSDPVLKAIPVVAMTAGATKTKIDELLAAGMTDYITKPFTQDQLEDTLVANIKPCCARPSRP